MKYVIDFKIEKNNKINPVRGIKNNCYDITYKTHDGYGGLESRGFSVDIEIYDLLEKHFENKLKEQLNDQIK